MCLRTTEVPELDQFGLFDSDSAVFIEFVTNVSLKNSVEVLSPQYSRFIKLTAT